MCRKISVRFVVLAVALMLIESDLFAQTKRIVFRRDSTSATVSGRIAAIRERSFVLGARAGQYLSATVSSSGGCVEFDKGRGTPGGTSLNYTTSSGSNYIAIVNNCNRRVSYSLTVSIE